MEGWCDIQILKASQPISYVDISTIEQRIIPIHSMNVLLVTFLLKK